ncbi:septum formation family protein [Corynebacterium sp. 335C]
MSDDARDDLRGDLRDPAHDDDHDADAAYGAHDDAAYDDADGAYDAGPADGRRRASNSWRDGWGLRAASAAMLAGGLVAGGAMTFADVDPGLGLVHGPGTGETAAESSGPAATSSEEPPDDFTAAQRGDCLTWDDTTGAALEHLHVVACGEPHLFETTARVNVDELPQWSAVFSEEAGRPTEDQILALRAEVCVPAADEYLGGKFNPAGRFIVSQMLPPATDWDEGDRTLLCGIQVHDVAADRVIPFRGAVHDLDQAVIREPGTCATIDENNQLVPADCAGDHLFEATGFVDLAADFPDHGPTVDEQNAHLADRCSTMATDYLGAPDALYGTDLLPFWFTVDPALYPNTRSVNCWIAASAAGSQGFSVLSGSVQGGQYTVDGVAPDPDAGAAPNGGGGGNGAAASGGGAAGANGADGTANGTAGGGANGAAGTSGQGW